MHVTGGTTNYGQDIGILMLDTVFPRIIGDIGNARTYPFPVRYKIVKNAFTERIMKEKPEPELLKPFIEAAQELEAEGVKAITTSCGFLAPFQRELADVVSIPVFTSALMLVPLVHTLINHNRKIAIFTERAKYMNEGHFNKVGWSSKDIPVIIKGMHTDAVFPSVFIGNKRTMDADILVQEMEEMTREHMKAHPETGAIVFECTNMGPFASHVQELAKVPVFGINQLIEYIASVVNVKTYYGFHDGLK